MTAIVLHAGQVAAAAPVMVPMHGIGGRQDLPVPLGLAVTGAAVAIALSFVILGVAWRSPKYRGATSGKALPGAVTAALDSAGLRWTVRLFGLAVFLYAGMALLAGADRLTNPIFGFVYILVWVGLVPLSLVLGPVWRTLNPLRTLHLLACRAFRRDPRDGLSDSSRTALPGLFAHSVVPIVFGYVIAHYFTLFVLEGQRALIMLSDPLSKGWNVFGTGLLGVNAGITNHTTAIATLQVGAVVAGHLLGVVSAHDRAVALFPRSRALAGQIPLLVVMVAYTVGGLLLLFSA